MSSYNFYNSDRIDSDTTDMTQRTVQNTKFANYTLSNYFSENAGGSNVQFATQQPVMMFSGTALGNGVGANVDVDSYLMINTEQERALERLQLMERPFLTVPYLGRGSCDPTLESQLQQGEIVWDKKSVSTVMDKSFLGYTMHPQDDNMKERCQDSKYTVQEAALDGWVRGGAASREMSQDPSVSKAHRPSDGYY